MNPGSIIIKREKNNFRKVIFWCLIVIYGIVTSCARNNRQYGWPAYRHDCARSGITAEKLPSEMVLDWTYMLAFPPQPAWSLPAGETPRVDYDDTYYVSAANGIACFGSSVDNKVYALDITTGKQKWAFYSEGPVRFSPVIWDNRIYFGSDDGYVYCLKAKNGKLIWKYHPGPKEKKVLGNGRMISLWPVRTSVLVKDGTVYFGAGVFPYDGLYICALNAKNGNIIWKNDNLDDDSFDLDYGGVSPQSYLIASEDKLFVPSGRAMPAVFDRKNGKFLYYMNPGGRQGGTWGMITQGELIAGMDNVGIPAKVAYNAETGERKGNIYASFTGIDMVVSGDVSYVVNEYGIYAINRIKYPVIQQKIDTVIKVKNQLARILRKMVDKTTFSNKQELNKETDKMIGKLDSIISVEETLKASSSEWFFPQKNLHSIILTGNQVIAGGKGMVLGLDIGTGKKLWTSNVEGTANGLSVSDHRLIVSTDKGLIYCFKKDNPGKKGTRIPNKIKQVITASPFPDNKVNIIYEKAAYDILKEVPIKKGYCLVLNCGEGQLAYNLAKQSDLYIVGIENDPGKVQKAKKRLDQAGLYGSRVIVENWSINSLPDYFADLIVSGNVTEPGKINVPPNEIFRVLKPFGGKICFGHPENINKLLSTSELEKIGDKWKNFDVEKPVIIRENGNWIIITRKRLAGAGGWTHQYADAANTCCSDDKIVKAPYKTLWYGAPGPQLMVERHAKAEAPLAFDGKLIVEGENIIMVYNAYNGTLLWKREIKGANRVRADVDGGNMAVNQYGLFVAVHDKCLQLNLETGKTIKSFSLPAEWKGNSRRWGYIALKDTILFGSAAMPLKTEYNQIYNTLVDKNGNWRKKEDLKPSEILTLEYCKYLISQNTDEVQKAFQREGLKWHPVADFPDWSGGITGLHGTSDKMMTSDGVFAKNIITGKTLWAHKGREIAQITICIGDQTVFFAEKSINPLQKQKASIEKQRYISKGKWEKYYTELSPDEADIRLVYALDAITGREKWKKAVDLSGCGDDETASAYKNNVLLFFGSYGLHDKWRFSAGQLKWHRVTALSAKDGELMWSRPLNYMVRPVIIKDEIIIEPRKCDLFTGQIKTRIHPVTGEKVPWEYFRPGHTCAITSANENCLFYRSYTTAYYDLREDKGMCYYGATRPGCLINLIPGNGLLLFPEASSGCTCSFPLRTTAVLKPEKKENVEEWSLYISNGPMTPVKHLAINLGAPGDKKDNNGTIWFGYPRPDITHVNNYRRTGVRFDLHEKILKGMGYYSYDSKGVKIDGTNDPWLFTNGCVGFLKCEIPLINDSLGEKSGVFTVRLGFVSPSTNRNFDIKIQDNIVMKNLDILKEAGDVNKAVVKEFKGINVDNNLSLALVPKITNPEVKQAPVINFIEIIREDSLRKSKPVEKVINLNPDEAEKILIQADIERDKKDYDVALEKYHVVLNGCTMKELKMIALKGMESIGSIKSLPEIKKYCQKLDPIMWDYKEPDQDIIDAAIRVYIAIANNIAKEDKERAIKMLNHIFSLTKNMTLCNMAISNLKNLGTKPEKGI